MTERDESLEDEAPVAPLALPGGLRTDWPVPRVGVYGRREGIAASAEAALVLGVLSTLGRLPAGARELFVRGVARVARRFDRRHSDYARDFLQQALGHAAQGPLEPRELERRVLAAWRHLIHVTIDSNAFQRRVPAASLREHYQIEIGADAQRLIAQKRGAIVVTAHIGDWEAGSALLPWIGFDPMYVISKPPKNRPLSVHMQTVREERGLRALPRRGAMRHVPAILRAGGSVAMMLDQRARQNPVYAPFFGRRARCDRSAGVLLKRLSAPIVFGACYRTAKPFSWRFVMPSVIWPEEGRALSVEELVARVNREMERLILAAPEQYFWLHDRYRGGEDDRSAV